MSEIEVKEKLTVEVSAEDDLALLHDMRERFEQSESAEVYNRQAAVEDLDFVFRDDKQWRDEDKELREGRLRFTFNRLRARIRTIVGDQRQNRPGINIRAIDDQGDPDRADILQGLIRNIQSVSDADTAYDWAFLYALSGGIGAWRITTDYEHDETFDQCLYIKRISNPFTVYWDPDAQDFEKRDARYCFVTEEMPREQFREQYPDKAGEFEGKSLGEAFEGWFSSDSVRIAEYWTKEPITKTIAELPNGEVIDWTEEVAEALTAQGVQPVRTRDVESHKVVMRKVTATEVLEGPYDWPGQHIPIVPVFGELVDLEGEMIYAGLIRASRDAQRAYNYARSTMIETIALQPKAPFMATAKQVEGYEEQWKTQHKKNYSLLLYNPDPEAGGRPEREQPPTAPTGLLAEAEAADGDIQHTLGIFNPQMGQEDMRESSGRAIIARQRRGDLGTFLFVDNLAKALKYTGEILVDLIPKIYDGERVIRILGEDGRDKQVTINQTVMDPKTGQPIVINDMSMGRYDVTITTGPSYATQREEAADKLLRLIEADPAMAAVAGDLLIKNMDMPEAKELEGRLRKLGIQKGLIEPGPEDEKPPPNPQAEMEMRKMAADVQNVLSQIKDRDRKTELSIAKAMQEAKKGDIELQQSIEEVLARRLKNMLLEAQFMYDPATGQIRLANPDFSPQEREIVST